MTPTFLCPTRCTLAIFLQGDITKPEQIGKVLEDCPVDVVFHCASYGMSGREQVRECHVMAFSGYSESLRFINNPVQLQCSNNFHSKAHQEVLEEKFNFCEYISTVS